MGEGKSREEPAEIKELISDMQRKAKLSEVKFSRSGTEKNVRFAEEIRKAYSGGCLALITSLSPLRISCQKVISWWMTGFIL